ncbi:MAG: hypothetical protein E7478_08405 [Ruminococcaceae bacterium]|nr:hypothetical protein [Oscillospiraceae bacterium]
MDFLVTVCMAAIASALYRMLVPEGKFQKQISLLIVSVFLLAGINAISGAELSLDTEQLSVEGGAELIGFSGDVNKSLQKKICSDMSAKLYELLDKNGIRPEQIHVNVNISGLYSISITQVKLVFNEGEEQTAAQALRLVRAELPEEIEVVVA